MDATVSDLIATIGEQTVELRLLRQAVSDLKVAVNLRDQEIKNLTVAEEEVKTKKKKEK